jgi:uncharacterized protein YecE (DUF72 family)
MKRLADPGEHVALFLERASALGRKLGVVLFQLPPLWKFDPARLEDLGAFLLQQKVVPGIRAAVELRHESWLCDACFQTLRRRGIALVFSDWPTLKVTAPLTADFVFQRRHGPGSLYASSYSVSALRGGAKRLRGWLDSGLDVHAYFNNDHHAYAVRNARTLGRLLDRQHR